MTADELAALREAVRDVIREELAAALKPHVGDVADATSSAAAAPAEPVAESGEVCGVPGRGDTVCVKPPKHGQRHRYGQRPRPTTPPPPRSWVTVDSYQPPDSAFALVKGSPVAVDGLGKKTAKNPHGAVGYGWVITGLERNVETDEVNVTVKHKTKAGHPRCVRSHLVTYDPPKRRRGQ